MYKDEGALFLVWFCIIAIVLGLFAISTADCRTPQEREADSRLIERIATKSAQTHARKLGVELAGVACMGNDSDGNGYVSCDARTTTGEGLVWECGYTPDSAAGCKTRNSALVTERER